jgi:AAA domain-containing protein/TOTE conflict system primase-like protein
MKDLETVASEHVAAFAELLRGNPSAHYIRTPEGEYKAVERGSTLEDVERHLAGREPSILSIPILPDGNCHFGALDVDRHLEADPPVDHAALAIQITRLCLPLVVCRSKNPRSAHLWLFLKEKDGCPATVVRQLLERYRQVLVIPGEVEVFPKQEKLEEGQKGNGINLPFHGSSRIGFGKQGDELSLEGFLELAQTRRSFGQILANRDLQPAPSASGSVPSKEDRALPIGVIRELHTKNLDQLRNAREHSRNVTLNTVAFFAARAFAAKALEGTEAEIKNSIRQAALDCGLAEREISQTALSGWASGITQPLVIIESNIVIENFSNLTEEQVEWVWQQKIPRSMLIVFSGNPDCGKTTVAIHIVACLTTGRAWPDGAINENEPSEVLMMIAEDDLSRTIKPRLMAAGANISKVHYLKLVETRKGATRVERRLALDTDIALLRETLKQYPNIKLIVADPITGYLGNANMNKEQAIRAVLEPIKQLCEEVEVTFLALGHFNKRSDVASIHRISGAVAMTGVPRAVWAFGPDPDVKGEYLMTMVKGNLAKDKSGMRFRIVEKALDVVGGQPIIEWLGKSLKTTDDLVARKDPAERKLDKAIEFLREFLKDGPQLSNDVFAKGGEIGIGERTLWTAKETLGVKAKKEKGQWYWQQAPSASEPKVSVAQAPMF